MTEPEEWMIRPAISTVHSNMAPTTQFSALNQSQMDQFNQWGQNIAGKDALAAGTVPVSAAGVNGAVRTSSIGIAPATSVAVDTTNMLVSQNFSSADTVAGFANWSWDGSDGNLTLGCAKVFCNGMQDDLVSNEVPVIFGENIEVSCQTKFEDIVYTGTDPIVLGVQKYRQGRDPVTGGVVYLDVGGVDVASLESPAADGGWGTDADLAGTYVVEAGVDQLRFRFSAPGITSGTVKWDEAVFLKLDLIDDAAVPGVGTTVDDIVTNLFGTQGDSFTHNEAALALANTAASIVSINARLSATEAEAGTGAIAADDFLFNGEITAHADWGGGHALAISNGSYAANGADAIWEFTPGFPGTQTCWFDWQGTDSVSDTDYQLVQLLLSSAPVTHAAGFKSYIHLLGRISSGFGSYVRAGFGSDGTYFVDYWNGSAFTIMDSGTCAVPGSGTLLSLYCGDKATTATRRFTLKANQVVVADFTESGSGSSLGGSNRKWGWGGKAEGGFFLNFIFGDWGQAVPPKVNQWLGYDQ